MGWPLEGARENLQNKAARTLPRFARVPPSPRGRGERAGVRGRHRRITPLVRIANNKIAIIISYSHRFAAAPAHPSGRR
jgi:hypothetical protein